jgi:hypothetical protein
VQIGTGHDGFKMGQATTIQTGSTLLDKATSCALGGSQAGFDEQIDHWYPGR